MTIKALYILDSLNRGGAETLVLDLCRNSAACGLDVEFAATGGGDLEREFAESGVTYHRLDRRFPIDPFLIRDLRRIIKDRAITVVHTQQAVEAIHAYFATRGTGVKCVMSLQNYILDNKNRIATKWIVPRLDAVCPVSYAMQDWYRDAEEFEITNKYVVVHNGVDIKRIMARGIVSSSIRDEIGVAEGALLLGMVGNFRLDAAKDQLTVCRALAIVFLRFPDAHFVFAGNIQELARPYVQQCKDALNMTGIGNRVHFLGSRGDVPAILKELDLFVFSSRHEGLPLAAVEALIVGVPMLVSDIGPLLEVIGVGTSDGPCGEKFVTGDAKDLAEKLEVLMEDKDMRRALSEKARLVTPKTFSIDAHIAALKSLYQKICGF